MEEHPRSRKQNRQRKFNEKGKREKTMPVHARSLKRTLSRHIKKSRSRRNKRSG